MAKHRRRGPPTSGRADTPGPEVELGSGGRIVRNFPNGPLVGPRDGSADAAGCRPPSMPTRTAASRVSEVLAYVGIRLTIDEIVEKVREIVGG